MKILLLIILTIITSCKVLQDKYLYDENSPSYAALKEAAAKECLTGNAIFENLKADSFTDYPILAEGNIIEVKNSSVDPSVSNYITIISRTADKVIFSYYNPELSVVPYMKAQNYEVDRVEDNNKLVTMIANGVCRDNFEGNPSSSNSELTFKADRFFSPTVETETTPSTYERREDKFTMNQNMPAFLFLWQGTIKGTKKETSSGEITSSGVSVTLELTSLGVGNCPAENDICRNPDDNVDVELSVNESEYAQVRTTTDISVKRFYFNEFSL